MNYAVRIGTATLKGVDSITINSTASQLSDLCTITLPGMLYNQGYSIEGRVKRGDRVVVELGYNGILRTEFAGYLKSVHPNAPMKIECEDSAYLFRKPIKDKQFGKTTVVAILDYVVGQINAQLKGPKIRLVAGAGGMQFDKFTIVRANGYEVLEKLRQETGLAIFFRGDVLHCSLLYAEKAGDVVYDFARNVEESDGLEYVRAEDVKVRVKVTGQGKKGKTVVVETGETGGELRELRRPAVSDKDTLAAIGQQELKSLSYDGYKGALKAWLLPVCAIGYTAKVMDAAYPERAGSYYVNAVKTEFSSGGGRRTVGLGIKLSATGGPGGSLGGAKPDFQSFMRDVEAAKKKTNGQPG